MPQAKKDFALGAFHRPMLVSLKLYDFSGFVIIVHAMLRCTMNHPRLPFSLRARKQPSADVFV
jgi:hypothetical protein